MVLGTQTPGPVAATPAVPASSVDRFSSADLKALLAPRPWPCVSLYLPTHRHGKGVEQDPARLRALLGRAEAGLEDLDLARDAVDAMLRPARELVADRAFWRFQADGLALFAAPGRFRSYRLPIPFPERVEVGERFALTPLVPLLDGGGRFYVLALSLGAVRLLEADRWGVARLDLGPVPASMDDALGYAQYYTGLGMHSASPQGIHGQPGVVFHGHGDADEDRMEQDVRHYFQRVARALEARLPERDAPIVLAAVAEHLPRFRDAARGLRVLEEAVLGNPELRDDEELRAAAWHLVEPRLTEARRRAVTRWVELGGSGRAAAGLDAVVAAADRGVVESLLLAPGEEGWGSYEPDLGRVTAHTEREPGDDDLVDLAVVRTLEAGGDVFAVAPEELGAEVEIAAVLRF